MKTVASTAPAIAAAPDPATGSPPAAGAPLPPLPPELSALPALVVKDGVSPGGLGEEARGLTLALVWAGLPQGDLSEKAVNEALRAQLAGPACWLQTDHVELRRWLVDARWLQRDGFGRVYRRVPASAMSAGPAALARAVAGLDLAEFVIARRAAHAAQRQARRRAWQQAGSAGGADDAAPPPAAPRTHR